MTNSDRCEHDRRELERAIEMIRDGIAMGRRGFDVLFLIEPALYLRSADAARALWSACVDLRSHEADPRFFETWAAFARARLEGYHIVEQGHAHSKQAAETALAVFGSPAAHDV